MNINKISNNLADLWELDNNLPAVENQLEWNDNPMHRCHCDSQEGILIIHQLVKKLMLLLRKGNSHIHY